MILFHYTERQIERVGDCHPVAKDEKAGTRNNVTVLGGKVLTNYKMHLALSSLCPHMALLKAG